MRSCQPWYWSLSALQVPLAILCTALVARRLWQQHHKRLSDGDDYHPDELHFGPQQLVTYPLIALVAGVIAGLLGIGESASSCSASLPVNEILVSFVDESRSTFSTCNRYWRARDKGRKRQGCVFESRKSAKSRGAVRRILTRMRTRKKAPYGLSKQCPR